MVEKVSDKFKYNNKFFSKFYVFTFLILFCLLNLFIPDETYANKKIQSIKPNAPVKVQADSMKYFGDKRISEFNGNVVAVSDNFTLTSDNVTVFLNKSMDVDQIKCNGNVNFKSKDIVSISDEADVDQRKGIATISGNVKVWQKENFLEGEKIYIYYNEEKIVVDKGTEKRVTIIFKPDEEGVNFGAKSRKP